MSQEHESTPPSSEPTAVVVTAPSTTPTSAPSPAPPSIDEATRRRIEVYRQVVQPTMRLVADLFWRVLLLAAAVWLIAMYLNR